MKAEWFVAWVATGQESELLERIRHTPGVMKAICPMLELWRHKQGAWTLRKQIVFPGYIFLRCRMSSAVYYAIKDIPGVLGWLGRDSMWPTTVRQEEMDVVLALDQGVDPGTVLTDAKTDNRRRRAYGSLTLQGKQYRIPYNVYSNNQVETPAGDASPEDTPKPITGD